MYTIWMYIDLRTIIISPVLIKNKFLNMASGDNGGGDKGGKKNGGKRLSKVGVRGKRGR